MSEIVILTMVLFGLLALLLFFFITSLKKSIRENRAAQAISLVELAAEKARKVEADGQYAAVAEAAQAISLAELAAEKAREVAQGRSSPAQIAAKRRKVEADSQRVEAYRQHATTAAAEQAISLAELAAEKAHGRSSPAQEDKDHNQRIVEAKEVRKVEAVKARKVEAAKKVPKVGAAKARKVEADAEKLALRFTDLKSNLPFHTSKKPPSAELAEHDKRMWDDVKKLVKEQDSKKATLYFVKIRSLMDDNEYYKIGMTTAGVKARFKKSTQVELLETICSFDTELWKAAYLEYHFLREFRLYDGLSTSIGEQRPEVGFSGYTEVVRSNSVNKISEYFEELGTYNEME